MGKGGDNQTAQNITGTNGAVPTTQSTTSTRVDAVDKDPQQDGFHDFFWSATDEPHATRRKLILTKYPEIKKLYGHCAQLKYKVYLLLAIQGYCAYQFRNQFGTYDDSANVPQRSWWLFLLVAYVVGGTCNHMCMMAMHELSHNLGFKSPKHNRLFAMLVANVPLAVPSAVTFKRYHMDHHKYQGVDGIDVDIPTIVEGHFFRTTLRKFFFVLFQSAFYSIRPTFVNPKPPGVAEMINITWIFFIDAMIAYFWGISSLAYLLASSLLGMGLHPVAGHFIAEHYVFPTEDNSVPETYSYYGPCNYFNFNVGYHNEHHDFPFVPGSRLPKLNQIAAEFYDVLPRHTSYVWVMYDYITNPAVTGFSRVKRPATAPDPEGVITDQDEKQFDVSLTSAKTVKSE
jgi:sphingolipid 4-desaturase/C4-monooxygenase